MRLPARYRYASTGERIDNITDWALMQFRDHYGKAAGVTKNAIFHYVHGAAARSGLARDLCDQPAAGVSAPAVPCGFRALGRNGARG